MSFIEEHYEKVAIGVGALVLAGGIYYGVTSISSSTEYAAANDGKSKGVPPEGTLKGKVSTALASLSEERSIIKKLDPSNEQTELCLLKSITFHGKKDSLDLLDLSDPAAKNIHEEIPNAWFFENGLSTEIGLANVIELDSDKDGFTNLEEFKAETNPTSEASYPPLFPKLKLEKVDSSKFMLTFTEINKQDINVSLRQKKPNTIRHSFKLKPGETGPKKKPGKILGNFEERFTFEKKENSRSFNGAEITLKDNGANGRLLKFNRRDKFQVTDLKAYVYLDALGLGNAEAYMLKKGDKFALPFTSEEKNFEVIDIALQEGSESLYTIKISNGKGEEFSLNRE